MSLFEFKQSQSLSNYDQSLICLWLENIIDNSIGWQIDTEKMS